MLLAGCMPCVFVSWVGGDNPGADEARVVSHLLWKLFAGTLVPTATEAEFQGPGS